MEMNICNHTIVYVSAHNPETDLGVTKKIEGFCAAARKKGYKTIIINRYCHTNDDRKELLHEAMLTDARFFFLRSFGSENRVFRKELFKAKQQGRVLILDQPTPMSSQIHEIMMSESSIVRKVYHVLRLCLNGPWGQLPFDKIIQYAEESRYFSLFNRKRTLLMGNGINIDRIHLRTEEDDDPYTLRLVGVAANVNQWHGFDRIIRAMGEWKRRERVPKIKFDVVGRLSNQSLQMLAKDCDVQDDVIFYGPREIEFINSLLCRDNLAVGSLGLYRNGLSTSSVLKVREYCLAGIPFIAAGNDPDFPNEVPFRFVIPNNDSIEPILQVFMTFYKRRKLFTNEDIHNYALDNLTFDAKFCQIIGDFV